MKTYLGLDIGTTATKAALFDGHGKLLSLARAEYPLRHPHAGWAEQEVGAIAHAIEQALASLPLEQVAGTSLGCAMHGLLAVDDANQPLTPLLTWADTRAAAEAAALKAGGLAPYHRTGTPLHPMAWGPKLRWLAEHQPEVFARARCFVSFKEWLVWRWTGRWLMDPGLASSTGLLSLATGDWDAGMLDWAGVGGDRLPELAPATTVLDGPHGPLVLGSGDGMLANLGVGAVAPGEVALTIGTSGAVRTLLPHPRTDARMRTFCYAFLPGMYLVGGATSNGGEVLRWLRDTCCAPEVAEAARDGRDVYDRMAEAAASVPPGSEGLLMLPFLAGERAPAWNADARGMFFGLSLSHERRHLIRAAMEGVGLGLDAVLRALVDLEPGLEGAPLRASGGFAKSDAWCQLMADLTGRRVDVAESVEASALGAALLAAYALGDVKDLAAWRSPPTRQYTSHPDPAYDRLRALYQQLYAAVAPLFGEIKGLTPPA